MKKLNNYSKVKICRICITNLKLLNIYLPENEELLKYLKIFVDVKNEDTNELPEYVCQVCSENLKNAFELKIRCQEQDEIFRKNIEETKSEIFFDDHHLPTLVPINFSSSTIDNQLEIKTEVFCENLPELNQMKEDLNSNESIFKEDQDDEPSTSTSNSKFCYICQEFFKTNKELMEHKETHLDCPLCNEKFNKYSLLISHRRKNHLTYPCNICGKILNTSTGLERHVRRLHLQTNNGIEEDFNLKSEINKETFCNICQLLFSSFNEMVVHRKTHFDCPVCDETFENYKEMSKHKFKEHKLINPCKFCDTVLKTVRGLETHVRSVHLNEKSNFCDLCPRTFYAKHTLTRHQKTVHGTNTSKIKINVLDEMKSVEIPEVVYNVPNEGKNHFCNICQNFYSSLKELLIHKKIHKECPVCKLKFVTHSLMIKHRREEHKNDNICKYCSKSLLTTLVLERHVRIIHFNEKLEKCLICNERFSSYPQLRNHKKQIHKIEAIEKPDKISVKKEIKYICQFCGKNFIKPFMFREHLRIHTNEKPFECRQCKQTFRLKCTYQRHVLSHLDMKKRPFKCTVCTKSFLTKLFLTAHMAKHTGEKNFKCEICNINFGYYNSLYDHKKNIHEGVRKSQCDRCSQWFFNNSLLNKHKKYCKK